MAQKVELERNVLNLVHVEVINDHTCVPENVIYGKLKLVANLTSCTIICLGWNSYGGFCTTIINGS